MSARAVPATPRPSANAKTQGRTVDMSLPRRGGRGRRRAGGRSGCRRRRDVGRRELDVGALLHRRVGAALLVADALDLDALALVDGEGVARLRRERVLVEVLE